MRRWENYDSTQVVGPDSSPADDVHVGFFVPAKSGAWRNRADLEVCPTPPTSSCPRSARPVGAADRGRSRRSHPDRKSTRLNSSHLVISYAVFCLKKKKNE